MMVSQPEYSRTVSLRGPSSLISRPSSSRHRRQARSHAGDSSYATRNDFPIFTNTGDVEIVVCAGGREHRYLLHRLILTQCSGFFEASTSQEWSRATPAGGELARIGEDSSSDTGRSDLPDQSKKRWRYELDTGSASDDIPMLIQKEISTVSLFGQSDPPPVRNKPPAAQAGFFRSVANLSLAPPPPTQTLSVADDDLLRDYNNLFRIFYNYSPSLDAINIADAYIQCKSLLSLADMYDALPIVGPRIDHHLLQFQTRLFKQIAKYPSSYLKLGYLSRSRVIFKEALIHVVGQWPVGERHLRNSLPETVLELIEDKVDELAEMVSRIEGRLFRLGLITSRGEPVTPTSNYMDWLVVSLFRQWLAENTSPSSSTLSRTSSRQCQHQPPPPYNNPPVVASNITTRNHHPASSQGLMALPPLGRMYRAMGSSSSNSYLSRDECKRFLKLTPDSYNRDTLKRFERRMEEIKSMARDIVRPLIGSGLQLAAAEGVAYLTCARIGDEDYVWEVEG